MLWSAAKINDESHDQETNDGNDLDGCEDELGFTIDLDGEDVQADDESDDESNPRRNRDVLCAWPILNDDRGGRDFGTESDCRVIPVLFEKAESANGAIAPRNSSSRFRSSNVRWLGGTAAEMGRDEKLTFHPTANPRASSA